MLDQLTIFGIISLANCVTCLFIGAFLFSKNTKNPVNISYCAFDFCIAFYAFFYFLWQSSTSEQLGIAFFKWCIVGVVLINSAFIHFTFVILNLHKKQKRWLMVVHAINLFFCYSALQLFYLDWQVKYTYGLWPIPSNVFHIYLGWWFFQVIVSFYLIYSQGVLLSQGKKKKQFQWIFWATMIAYAGGATNWFVWYGINFPPFLNSGIAIYTIVLAYAIFRHQLLDIRVVLTRTAIFLGLYSIIVCVSIFFAVGAKDNLSVWFGEYWFIPPVAFFGLATIGGPYIYLILQRKAEEYLLKEQRHYQQTLLQASRGMTLIKDLDRLLKLTVHLLTRTIKLKNAAIYLFDKDRSIYELKSIRYRDKDDVLSSYKPESELIRFIHEEKKALLADEIRFDAPYPEGSIENQVLEDIDKLDVNVLIPSFVRDSLIGFVALGDKKKGGSYTEDDLQTLTTLSNQAALAIENCRFIEEIEQTQMQLFQAAKMNDLGTMASGIGHQINNRLNKITIASGICKKMDLKLIRNGFDSKDQELHAKGVDAVEKHLSAMSKNAHDGAQVVRNLLDFSRLSTGFEDMSISQAVDVSIDLLGCKRELKKINFANNVKADLPTIYASKSSLQEVIFNLLDNGFDAILLKDEARDLGKLPKVEEGHKDKISISASVRPRDDEEWMVIEVEDTGIGMEPETVQKLYVPFFTTKATVIKGTGLGVYVMKKMVDAHNGKIEVDSEYGKGTIFRVWFPLKQKKNTNG